MYSEFNPLARREAQVDWERARQSANIEGMLGLFSSSRSLLSFDEVQKQLRLKHKSYRGLQNIPVDQIRGSVGRYEDFTASFLPKKDSLRDRWQRVDAVALTTGFPPVEVFQVGEAYFVADGNHRVSVARQNNHQTIEAYVWEYTTPVGLSGSADIDEVLIKAEYAEFLEATALDKLYPDQEIIFTAPGRYRELLNQIRWYQKVLEEIDGEPCSWEYATTSWYEMLYTPAIQIIQEQGILDRFPGRTESDLFIWVWRHRQELQKEGQSVRLAEAAADLHGEGLKGRFRRFWHTLRRVLKLLR